MFAPPRLPNPSTRWSLFCSSKADRWVLANGKMPIHVGDAGSQASRKDYPPLDAS